MSVDNLEDTEMPVPAHMSQDSDSQRFTKVVSKSRKHKIFTHLLKKTEIAKYACEPKLQGPLAEDALVKQHIAQKSLVT